jgi:hypothetical protein
MTQTLDRRFVRNLQKATLSAGAATGRPAARAGSQRPWNVKNAAVLSTIFRIKFRILQNGFLFHSEAQR